MLNILNYKKDQPVADQLLAQRPIPQAARSVQEISLRIGQSESSADAVTCPWRVSTVGGE